MKQPRNWYARIGFLLGISGIASYFLLVLTYDPALHRWLEMPALNLLVIAAGLILSCLGAYRAIVRTHGARIVAPLLAALNIASAGVFGWWLFAYSYQMPAAARSPAIGAVAPDFALQDERGNEVRLSAWRGKPLVLLFYRGFW